MTNIANREEIFGSILRLKFDKDPLTGHMLANFWVSIRDKDGAPIKGLMSSDLKILETIDGVTREISAGEISFHDQPLAAVLLRDVSGSMQGNGHVDSQRALERFVDQMQPVDLASLVHFGSQIFSVQPFTEQKSALREALLRPAAGGETRLIDAVIFCLHELQRLDSHRFLKVLVVFSDGRDTTSKNSFQTALEVAAMADIPIFTVGVGEVDVTPLKQFAQASGGLFFHVSSSANLETVYTKISEIVRHSYLLSFPSRARPGDQLGIEIIVPFKDNPNRVGKFSGQFSVPPPSP